MDEEVACAAGKALVQKVDYQRGERVFQSYQSTKEGKLLGFGDMFQSGVEAAIQTDDKDLVGKWQLEVNGNQNLLVDEISGISDGQPGIKIAAAAVHIKVPHPCFAKPLKVFTGKQDGDRVKSTPTMNFWFRRYDDGWRLEGQKRY